jgi:3-oxoacyl-[acyl-carrier-protein] synthase-3
MHPRKDTVGISAIGCYIPKKTISSREIAQRAGIPVEVLTNKIGMQKKPVAGTVEQPSSMALRASRTALEKAELGPNEIDVIIYGGSAPQDYLLWSAAAKLQDSLGARNAFSFEITNGCNGASLGMQVAKNMMLGSARIQNALVVSADKYSVFQDYTIVDDVSLFHVADAAGAVILKKNEPTNSIIGYYQLTDGAYSDFVKIRNGGTMHPYSGNDRDTKQTFSLENPEELARLLTEVYTSNYVHVIRSVLQECGYTTNDIDFLFTNQVKASTIIEIFKNLEVPLSKTFNSIGNYGHMGTVDTLFALSTSLEEGRITPGDLVVLASSAIGFSWAAMVLQY